MNREILFKALQADGKGWVNGDLVKCDIPILPIQYKAPFILNEEGIWEIIPETVCQFTGLTAKNGAKGFEGDIVKYKGRFYVIKNLGFEYRLVSMIDG